MANKEDNLKPFDSNQSREQAKINGRKGGIASGEARRRRKSMRDMLEYLLDKEISDDGKTTLEGICVSIIKKAGKGDVRAFEVIRDTIGQKPIEKTLDLTPKNQEETQAIIDEIISEARGQE